MIKKLNEIFRGKHRRRAQVELDELSSSLPDKPNILWYPSAGEDFRDLIEGLRTGIQPDLYLHTDYSTKFAPIKRGCAFEDNRTSIVIEDMLELEFIDRINYFIDPEVVTFMDHANARPHVYLLNVMVRSTYEIKKAKVIYFYMENINFMEEVLFKYNFKISHVVKIRAGVGYTGGNKDMAMLTAFFSKLEVQRYYSDFIPIHLDFEFLDEVIKRNQLDLKNIKLINMGNIREWSALSVKIQKVEYEETPLTHQSLGQTLNLEDRV